LAPVTRQQLQQVVGLMVHSNGILCYEAGLLLALLLQRADPGRRAAFLNGPEASLLLAALVNYTSWEEEKDDGALEPYAHRQAGGPSWKAAKEELLSGWEGVLLQGPALLKPHVVVLLLTLCFLQPCTSSHGSNRRQQQQQQQQQQQEEEAVESKQQQQQQQEEEAVESKQQQQQQQQVEEAVESKQQQQQQQQEEEEEEEEEEQEVHQQEQQKEESGEEHGQVAALEWGAPYAITAGTDRGE
jgi:outer membrane biosynthesis protein TonB